MYDPANLYLVYSKQHTETEQKVKRMRSGSWIKIAGGGQGAGDNI